VHYTRQEWALTRTSPPSPQQVGTDGHYGQLPRKHPSQPPRPCRGSKSPRALSARGTCDRSPVRTNRPRTRHVRTSRRALSRSPGRRLNDSTPIRPATRLQTPPQAPRQHPWHAVAGQAPSQLPHRYPTPATPAPRRPCRHHNKRRPKHPQQAPTAGTLSDTSPRRRVDDLTDTARSVPKGAPEASRYRHTATTQQTPSPLPRGTSRTPSPTPRRTTDTTPNPTDVTTDTTPNPADVLTDTATSVHAGFLTDLGRRHRKVPHRHRDRHHPQDGAKDLPRHSNDCLRTLMACSSPTAIKFANVAVPP
jgi:hypothetical protein